MDDGESEKLTAVWRAVPRVHGPKAPEDYDSGSAAVRYRPYLQAPRLHGWLVVVLLLIYCSLARSANPTSVRSHYGPEDMLFSTLKHSEGGGLIVDQVPLRLAMWGRDVECESKEAALYKLLSAHNTRIRCM